MELHSLRAKCTTSGFRRLINSVSPSMYLGHHFLVQKYNKAISKYTLEMISNVDYFLLTLEDVKLYFYYEYFIKRKHCRK